MNILIACEESQRVCIAFRKRGHNAFSCDIIDCSGSHPEWHIKANVIPLLNGNCEFKTEDNKTHYINSKWDMIIAFPPCTYVSNAGARHLYPNKKLSLERYYKGLCGKALFDTILKSDCDCICVENPLPSKIFNFPKPTQIIQPYYFGEPYSKRTLLWLKGLNPLKPTKILTNYKTWLPSNTSLFAKGKGGSRGSTCGSKNYAKTFKGVAEAMAAQWG